MLENQWLVKEEVIIEEIRNVGEISLYRKSMAEGLKKQIEIFQNEETLCV